MLRFVYIFSFRGGMCLCFVCVFRVEGVCPPWPLPHLYRHPSVYWLMKNSWVCVWEQRNNFQYLARLWIQMMLNFGVLRWRLWRCLGAYECSRYRGRLRSAGLMRGWGSSGSTRMCWVRRVAHRRHVTGPGGAGKTATPKPTATNAAAG